ncbi:unnamed protein product, partial [Adineta steineri]
MEVGESNYALLSSPYDSFMQKHLQHYGYFTGRSEVVKKYGFVPSKPQLITHSSDSDSSSSDEEQGPPHRRRSPHEHSEYKGRPLITDPKTAFRQNRLRCGLYLRSQNDESSFEPRWPTEIEVLPESRVRHIDVQPKQPELFNKPNPKDHMPYVRSADEDNGRTVFNYNPETCGYYMRSRIGGNRDGCRQAAVKIRDSDDTTVLFESRFESGNLMKAVQVGEFEYELYLRYDLYTKRNTQWFYFRLQNTQANKRYRFTIVNFFKSSSLYSNGMRPLMYSVHDADNNKIGWRRWGEEIVYYRNNLTAPDNPSANMYSLTWTCKFPNDNDTYYFAHCYPYTYSDLQDYLNGIQGDRIKSQYCKQKVLCRSLAGNFVYMLTITSPPALSPVPEQQLKKGVVISARVHPGETNSSWMMKECLTTLYRALIYSPLNMTQIPTLFFLSETILYWIKNDAILEPFLTSTELKLLKIAQIIFQLLYYHYLEGSTEPYEELKIRLSSYLDGLEECESAYSSYPNAVWCIRYIESVGSVLVASVGKHALSSRRNTSSVANFPIPQIPPEDLDKTTNKSELRTSVQELSPILWHSVNLWSFAKKYSTNSLTETMNRSFNEIILSLINCRYELLNENWIDVVITFQILADIAKTNVDILETIQLLAQSESTTQLPVHRQTDNQLISHGWRSWSWKLIVHLCECLTSICIGTEQALIKRKILFGNETSSDNILAYARNINTFTTEPNTVSQ